MARSSSGCRSRGRAAPFSVRPLRYTFLGDGPSDRALTPVINWLLRTQEWIHEGGFVDQVADLWDPAVERARTLAERIRLAVKLYPCDVLVIHRDAEREPLERRWTEIEEAVRASTRGFWVPIVPVRMTEAWLLIDEVALRHAADNPSGTMPLNLPRADQLEQVADPKAVLYDALLLASEKRGRRRESFKRSLPRRIHRVADLIATFEPLRRLNAFNAFEERARVVLARVRSDMETD